MRGGFPKVAQGHVSPSVWNGADFLITACPEEGGAIKTGNPPLLFTPVTIPLLTSGFHPPLLFMNSASMFFFSLQFHR